MAIGLGGNIGIFFFNDTATTEIYTLSLHDALPIFAVAEVAEGERPRTRHGPDHGRARAVEEFGDCRSEEHTSELQSQSNLVCRLLLEKKKPNLQRHYMQLTHPTPQRIFGGAVVLTL